MGKNTLYYGLRKIFRFVVVSILVLFCITDLSAQKDIKYVEFKSKMWFISEVDHSVIMMDEEGNQFDHYDNFIVVYNKNEKIKIPYFNNYIFWDEYDENMSVSKKIYKVVIEQTEFTNNGKEKISYKLLKVFDGKKLIYDATKKNPYIEK